VIAFEDEEEGETGKMWERVEEDMVLVVGR